MILTQQENNIQVIGDTTEYKTSIDPKNIDFITTLLSSNLYSNPEQSFIREIVSNAWDSHVEAHTTDTPVIIKFSKESENYYGTWSIYIRDFGVGLSPERFQEIYCNIGSSTKRGSNEFIGGFGIGRYSALACSNIVYITSYYNGTSYVYAMTKDNNRITTHLLFKKPTNEKNGVEVALKNINNILPYKGALKYITFFPNIYVDSPFSTINTIQIKKYNNFAIASTGIDSKILIENVLYNLEYRCIKDLPFYNKIRYTGIVIKFKIGELDITPNRESIIYNEKSTKLINERIEEAKKEIKNIIVKKIPNNLNNLYIYYKYKYKPLFYDFFTEKVTFENDLYKYKYEGPLQIKFKNRVLTPESDEFLNVVFSCLSIPSLKGVIGNNKLYCNSIPIKYNYMTLLKYDYIVMLKNGNRLSSIEKEWLVTKYNKFAVIKNINKEEFISYIKNEVSSPVINSMDVDSLNILYEELSDYLFSKIITIDIKNDKELQSYKNNIKKNKSESYRTKDAIIYTNDNYKGIQKLHFSNLEEVIQRIKSLHTGIILTSKESFEEFVTIANIKNYKIIAARKDILKVLKNKKFTCEVNKEWLFNEDPLLIKISTILKTFDSSVISRGTFSRIIKIIPNPLKKECREIMNEYYRVKDKDEVYIKYAIKCNKTDPYVSYICNKLKHYIDIYNNISKELDIYTVFNNNTYDDYKLIFISKVIVNRKLCRIDYNLYKKVKNNKIIKSLCLK